MTPEEQAVYDAVMVRDGGCVAPDLDQSVDLCRGRMTRQHVKDGPGGRRITDMEHVLILCEHHHLDGWGTSKAALTMQRSYLRTVVE